MQKYKIKQQLKEIEDNILEISKNPIILFEVNKKYNQLKEQLK